MKSTKKIGLIGRGHLGKAIENRCLNRGVQLNVSAGRGHNAELAEQSDILLLTVRPNQVAAALEEIRGHTRKNALLISFAAAVPQAALTDWSQTHSLRAMTDIDLSQILVQANEQAASELGHLSTITQTQNEADIDAFTAVVGCLPGVAAWHRVYSSDYKDWAARYTSWAQDEHGISADLLQRILFQVQYHNDPISLLESVATKGGVTEAIVTHLSRGHTDFESSIQAGLTRIQEIAQELQQVDENRFSA